MSQAPTPQATPTVSSPEAEAAIAEASPQSLTDLMNKGNWSDKEIDELCAIFREQRASWRKDELAGKRPTAKKAPKAPKAELNLDDLEL